MTLKSFRESKEKFNEVYRNRDKIDSLVPVNGKMKKDISIKNVHSKPNEEYYKWQFIYSIISSGLFNKDYIGVEVSVPKGNPSSAPLRIDGAIFDDKEWINHYINSRKSKENNEDVDWLRKHMIAAIEFKNEEGDNIETYYNQQLKPAMKECETDYVIGFYYDHEKLWIFEKDNEKYYRYDDAKNGKGNELERLSLHLPDSFDIIPSFDEIKNKKKSEKIDYSDRNVNDLEPISGVKSKSINEDLGNITFTLDKVSLNSPAGYRIIIEMLALKIYDERHNSPLKFYILDEEKNYDNLMDSGIQDFIKRMNNIFEDAKIEYTKILENSVIDWQEPAHVETAISVVESFQNYSFIESYETDLYQLVFYKFSSEFAKDLKGQFLTPLKLISFLVNIVNPRGNDRLIDPCAGISDFLSVSYVNSINSDSPLNDANLYGIDNDPNMVMLSQLNMLLNGDGNAKIEHVPNHGSINQKFDIKGNIVELNHKYHQNGNWDNWPDKTELMKFDVVLTNPPFGKGRAFEPKTRKEKEIAELYELWDNEKDKSKDKGILFLENAVRLLKKNGRFGIVLSNSLASVDRDVKLREWLMDNVRIVALFELPPRVFTDTAVNTVLIVGYKPNKNVLSKLKENDYEIFAKNIENVGYEIKKVKSLPVFKDIYKIDDETFEIMVDENGKAILDEEFTDIITEFKEWVNTQEETLKEKFIG